MKQLNPLKISSSDVISLSRTEEVYTIVDEIIEELDEAGIRELTGGNESDIDLLLDTLVDETRVCIYGESDSENTKKIFSTLGHFESGSIHYLDKLTQTVEQTLRVENLTYFTLSVMDEFEISWHHVEWADIVKMYTYFCILAARDHGKSYFFSHVYPLWKMYRYNKRSRRKDLNHLSKEGYIFSFSQTQASKLLEIVRETIEDNSILRDTLYPDSTKDTWGKTEIKCKNGARLRVRGMGAATRGAHPGWIMVDDGLKDNVIYSKDQRNKSIEYFHAAIMNMILPGGQVGVVGTPFHQMDLYGDLKTKTGWHVREYPAIFPDGKILWDSRYDFDVLMLKRETQGSLIFSRELLCRPITDNSTIFPMRILKFATMGMEHYTTVNNVDSFPVKFVRVGVGVDLAISSSVGADFTVMAVGGIDEHERMWVLNIYRLKGASYNEQLGKLKSINVNFKPKTIFIESNQMQMMFADSAASEGLPVYAHTTGRDKYDFKTGLPSLALDFEQGKWKFPTGDQKSRDTKDLAFTELTSIAFTEKGLEGVGEHDDIAMALWHLKLALTHKAGGEFNFHMI